MAAFEVRAIEGKGNGIVATKNIPRGIIILTDKPILSVSDDASNEDIEAAFACLSKEDQTTFLSLYEWRPGHLNESKAVRIFHSNAFGNAGTGRFVLPLVSRINHSCVPNAVMANMTCHAQKDVAAEEEVQICYRGDWDEVLTASQRNLMFKYRYGFQCKCKVCLPSKHRWLSDRRRLLIGAARFALEGRQPVDFGQILSFDKSPTLDETLRAAYWPPKVPIVYPVRNAMQRIEYTFLVAKLREAEGVEGLRTAEAYYNAIRMLNELQYEYGKMGGIQGHGLVFVEAARCCDAWLRKAVEHATNVQGGKGEVTKMYRTLLKDADFGDILVAAGEDRSGGDRAKKCYLITLDPMGKRLPTFLTLRQSEEFFKDWA